MAGDKTALIITLLPPLMLSIYRPSFAAGGSNGIFLLLLFPLITLSIQLCRPSKPRDSLLHYKFASRLITSSCLINLVPLDRLEFSVKPKSLDCESDRLLHTENTWTMNPDPVTYTCERLERQPAVCYLYFGRCTDKSW